MVSGVRSMSDNTSYKEARRPMLSAATMHSTARLSMPLVMMLRNSFSRTASPACPAMAWAGAPHPAVNATTASAPVPAQSKGVRAPSSAMAPMMATSVKGIPADAATSAAARMSAALAVVKSA
ncbi:hypothetical protein D3C71_1503690 [compost metagenome]